MALKSIFTMGLMATAALGAAIVREEPFRCGSKSNPQHRVISKMFAAEEAVARRLGQRAVENINVGVYMHVIAESLNDTAYLSDEVLQKQLDVANQDFAPSGISFTLRGIDKTVNTAWANDGEQLEMRKGLRKGTYRDLNLYFLTKIDGFGYCTLPTKVEPDSEDFFYDGCVIRHDTVPGGAATNFNLGKTVTHEVGHWFGLDHTFEGGCDGDNDMVDDTPAQASSTKGCPIGLDSCPNKPGLDPIHNYMDYSYDSCYEEFTPGQIQRMHSFWSTFRA